ncbi:MAG: metallophosphoesterase [Flavobacteriaceae bacterium]
MTNRILILLGLFLLLDIYVWMGTRGTFSNPTASNIYRWFYGISALLGYIGLFVMFSVFKDRSVPATLFQNILMGFSFSFFVFKLLTGVFLLVDDLIRLGHFAFQWVYELFNSGSKETVSLDSRRNFIVKTGLAVASIPFASMLFGITKGKYWYQVKKVALNYPNLPKAFKGLKIVHISDVHSGSFDSKEDVARGIQLINEQDADLILFTGDLVNNKAEEVEPYIDLFSSLNAKIGKFSSLGNHDYGDYVKWDSPEAKQANMERLYANHEKMGFDLIRNENRVISKDGESIKLVGVENWGRPPFPQHGDLNKALEGVNDEEFKVLLSHDPTHWDLEVLKHKTPVELTLSGHTHGMQFGIEIPGWKWSPVKYIYKNWAGLYEKNNEKLYVNRGFGFLGFPGRVGIWPEITVIELT